MRLGHRVIFTTAVLTLIAALGITVAARSQAQHAPSSGDVAFATEVSNLMVNELVAALFTEFDETTPQNVEHGKQAISLIFNDLNRNMRLIGTFRPLLGGANNRPSDPFEVAAVRAALNGGQAVTDVQRINDRWYLRRSVPLSNTFHTACVLCHTNFTSEFFQGLNNPGQWVGALVLAVPIRTGDRAN
jgi:hypothetical protein